MTPFAPNNRHPKPNVIDHFFVCYSNALVSLFLKANGENAPLFTQSLFHSVYSLYLYWIDNVSFVSLSHADSSFNDFNHSMIVISLTINQISFFYCIFFHLDFKLENPIKFDHLSGCGQQHTFNLQYDHFDLDSCIRRYKISELFD